MVKGRRVLVISRHKDKISYPFEREAVDYIGIQKGNSLYDRFAYRLLAEPALAGLLLRRAFAQVRLRDYDVIIVNETMYAFSILRFLRLSNPHCRLIYLLWNTVKFDSNVRLYHQGRDISRIFSGQRRYDYSVVSFDRADCERYHLHHQQQFAYRFAKAPLADTGEGADIFFVGMDKGRLHILKQLQAVFDAQGLSFKCWLVPVPPRRRSDYPAEDRPLLLDSTEGCHHIPYEKIIQEACRSRAILDLVQEGQHGLTWRPLEALFYKKKLITNFKEIRAYDFYHQQNIFILGEDDIDQIGVFLEEPYREISEKIISQYTFSSWLQAVGDKR